MRIADCGLRIADCGLRIADCGLRIADCGLRIADCGNEEGRGRKSEVSRRVRWRATGCREGKAGLEDVSGAVMATYVSSGDAEGSNYSANVALAVRLKSGSSGPCWGYGGFESLQGVAWMLHLVAYGCIQVAFGCIVLHAWREGRGDAETRRRGEEHTMGRQGEGEMGRNRPTDAATRRRGELEPIHSGFRIPDRNKVGHFGTPARPGLRCAQPRRNRDLAALDIVLRWNTMEHSGTRLTNLAAAGGGMRLSKSPRWRGKKARPLLYGVVGRDFV